MTHLCCTSCRLRLPPSAETSAPCPMCGAETVLLDAEHALGFQRHRPEVPETLVSAVAVRLPGDTAPQTGGRT